MNKIFEKDFSLNNCIEYGANSSIFAIETENFIYKKYDDISSVKIIQNKIKKLKKYNSDKKIVFPIDFVYKNIYSMYFSGILFDYNRDYKDLDLFDTLDYNNKVIALKSVRNIIEYFHNEYKLVHGDIHPGNILYNDQTNDSKLIDLDTYINMKNKSGYKMKMSSYITNNYIKQFGINYELDLYLFNLLTISFLNNIKFFDIEKKLNNSTHFFDNNYVNKIVDSYKDIGSHKTLKKEYIIDYL